MQHRVRGAGGYMRWEGKSLRAEGPRACIEDTFWGIKNGVLRQTKGFKGRGEGWREKKEDSRNTLAWEGGRMGQTNNANLHDPSRRGRSWQGKWR